MPKFFVTLVFPCHTLCKNDPNFFNIRERLASQIGFYKKLRTEFQKKKKFFRKIFRKFFRTKVGHHVKTLSDNSQKGRCTTWDPK
jgi:hypothetical protein